MEAYHWEARRRQRVIDRKQEAQLRIRTRMEQEERFRLQEEERLAKEKIDLEDARKREREEHLRQRGEGGMYRVSRPYSNGLATTQRDLRYQQKVLRDHGLVMGHVNGEFLS